jgi:SAM-dependent methyltransferase
VQVLETDMQAARQTNDEQTTLWNGAAGHAWVEMQALLDRVMQPFETLLTNAVAARKPSRLLDVGCGTGATTIAAAKAIEADAACVGVDVSEPMLALARARAEREDARATFVRADAQTHRFDPPAFDMIISRFGVMFFDDPVAAFANLRRAATEDAELRFLSWRGTAENPFMLVAERAAAPFLPHMPPRDPDAPGQLTFADARRVERILTDSGWADVAIEPIDVACRFPEDQLVRWFTQLGPLGRVLHEADAETRNRIIDTVRPAYDAFVHGDEVRFDAAAWLVVARSLGEARG